MLLKLFFVFFMFLCLLSGLFILFLHIMKLPPKLNASQFKGAIIAHRGASNKYPENTLLAVRQAAKLGANGIEIDVKLTKDHIPVLMHDKNVDRTTNGHGLVYKLSLKQIQRLRIKYKGYTTKEKVPTLISVLKAAKQLGLMVDIEMVDEKHQVRLAAKNIIQAISTNYNSHKVFVSSFYPNCLYYIRILNPNITTALNIKSQPYHSALKNFIYQISTSYWVPDLLQVSIIVPEFKLISQDYIETFKKDNLVVLPFTVNNEIIKKYLYHLNIGYITDCPYSICDLPTKTKKNHYYAPI